MMQVGKWNVRRSMSDAMQNIYRDFRVDRDFERDCNMHASGIDIIAAGAYGNKLAILANGNIITYGSSQYVPESRVIPFRRVV